MTAVDTADESALLGSSSSTAQASMSIQLNIMTTVNSTTTLTLIYANLTSISGPNVTFCHRVVTTDPSGVVQFTKLNSFILTRSALVSASLVNRDFAAYEVPRALLLSTLSTIDNTQPVVISVTSPNISATYPFGVGDVIDIYVTMSHAVVLGLNLSQSLTVSPTRTVLLTLTIIYS
jgi:hypothetical protein